MKGAELKIIGHLDLRLLATQDPKTLIIPTWLS